MTNNDNKPDNKRAPGRPKGVARSTNVHHGGYCKNPIDAYRFWKRHRPDLAEAVDSVVKLFQQELGQGTAPVLLVELQEVAVLILSRDLMTGALVDADFSRMIHDPETRKISRIRENHLFDRLDEVDGEVQKRLEKLGLKSNYKDTEGDDINVKRSANAL